MTQKVLEWFATTGQLGLVGLDLWQEGPSRFLQFWEPWAALSTLALAFLAYRWRMQMMAVKQQSSLQQLQRLHDQRIENLKSLLESVRIINSRLSFDDLLLKIAAEGARLVEAEPGSIGIVEGEYLVFKALWYRGMLQEKSLVFPLGKGIAGKVAQTGKPYIVNNPDDEPSLLFPEDVKLYAPHGFMDIPIVDRNGKVVGVLDVRRPGGRLPFDETDVQILELFAHQAAVAIENGLLYSKLEQSKRELEEKNKLVEKSLREIESLYKNEQKVNRMLQELNQMKTNFMIVTSHELRTPLSVLKSHLEFLSEGLTLFAESQREAIEGCISAVERLVENVENIQTMLEISGGKIELDKSTIDLCQMIRDIVIEVEPFAKQRKQKLVVDVPGKLVVNVDSTKLHSALVNILQNAIKFSYDKGSIYISLTVKDAEAIVAVRDEGIGIENGELEKIFEKFYTCRDPSKHTSGKFKFSARGSGLGLSIARSYVEAHQGKVYAVSEGMGRGSTFYIHLPLGSMDN
ncbi:MAG: GAF domain-containing sensor histidine kinase [Acidobacteriota bacterium]|nr:GAF domain-containing sensor histidine kinase [Blastocatellia bacterium]MDW8412412.1 GAF domain-containing sensor histidine kinase [Acidobacteriota bacterium]